MKIAIACDHAATEAKDALAAHLKKSGYDVTDCGTHGTTSVDYPDLAVTACKLVASGEAERGILLCGSGIGMSIAANKVKGIRAAMVSESLSARLCREHNDANVLCLGARFIGPAMIQECAEVFLKTAFGGERHQKRVDKLNKLDC